MLGGSGGANHMIPESPYLSNNGSGGVSLGPGAGFQLRQYTEHHRQNHHSHSMAEDLPPSLLTQDIGSGIPMHLQQHS